MDLKIKDLKFNLTKLQIVALVAVVLSCVFLSSIGNLVAGKYPVNIPTSLEVSVVDFDRLTELYLKDTDVEYTGDTIRLNNLVVSKSATPKHTAEDVDTYNSNIIDLNNALFHVMAPLEDELYRNPETRKHIRNVDMMGFVEFKYKHINISSLSGYPLETLEDVEYFANRNEYMRRLNQLGLVVFVLSLCVFLYPWVIAVDLKTEESGKTW